MKLSTALSLVLLMAACLNPLAVAQPYDDPDRGQPGDEMIQTYLGREAARIHDQLAADVASPATWLDSRDRWLDEYYYMLGLQRPVPRTPLQATVTGNLQGDGYEVDLLHFQSRPGLYVTGNLYRPAGDSTERRPAVLYVCGHSYRGRDGNKVAYQSHGIWFARHGYVCLVIDSLQLGEIAALHHGTYREQRWWWHSRGYTPAGVECLNGIRAIDYLVSRDDVDPRQVAVTGISGGGAASFWIAAADERVAVAVPVSGMADLPSYVGNRVINGHCDCMFLHNAFSWPWTRIAGLVAPRPLLFVNSDHDGIFPMDANDRVIARLERVYRLYGAGDMVDSVISIGGHAYREDIRKAAYRFVNLHLKNDSRLVVDSEVDLVSESNQPGRYAIEPTRLRVFPTDADLPADQLNTRIDELFVPLAAVELPSQEHFSDWQRALRAELRRVALRRLPDRIPAATVSEPDDKGPWWLATEEGIRVRLRRPEQDAAADAPRRVVLVVAGTDGEAGESTVEEQLAWFARFRQPGDQVYSLEPRGVGATRWTSKNPPNYVERSHVLVGQTVDTGRIRDIVATARYLKQSHESLPVVVAGRGAAAVLAAYAGMLEQEIDALVADTPPLSHMQAGAPQVLNALRVCDVPHVVGMCAPRPLTLRFDSDVPDSEKRQFTDTVSSIYAAAGATPDL